MIETSTELFNAFLEDTRQIKVRVTIGDRVFDNDNIATLSLEYGSMDGGSLDIGGAFANSLKIGFSELVEGLKELDEIKVELGAVLPNETIEYVKMGTFIINEEVVMDRNNNTTSIDAMDRMVMLGETYESTLEGDYARIIDIAVDIANQAGVIVSSDFDRLRTDSILIPREKTLREAIGIIAQFEVGFAIFNRDGELTIRGLKDAGFHVSPEEYTMKGLVKNEVPFRLNGVQCTTGDGEDDVLTSGGTRGNQIYLQNESMTQEHLNRIHQSLTSLNYYPFTLDWYGHPALEAGDWIEIEDLQGNKFKTPNLHYTLDFNGGLKAKSQAETTSSSEVVYQYKSPLKQEIQAIAARLSASGGNHVYDDLTPPTNPKEGDLWFKPEGPDTIILIYERLEDGSLDWVEKLNTGDTTKNADAIAEQQLEIEDARQVADEAVEQIDTAVANAGFTSLDDTIQNMNYITMTAEQNAQQAITNASNAYGLAQTSISEAQTAQANSLTALGKADNALDGVSNLDIRVDDVEAELELKADNAFMNEDGTLTTLSNAITFNAHRFSSDMSRIESRVESLAGEVNLVILRGSIENKLLYGGEVFPNAAHSTAYNSNVMGELIEVKGGETFALSKEMTGFDDRWRINFYDENHNFISRFHPPANTQDIMNAPVNARYMWVSYPKDSKPQITRGTDFIPYRPNLADQMTTDEMVIFRNEYDEYADRTERRLSAIDSTGGSLEVLENKIVTTADSVRTDMTALINNKVDDDEFNQFYQNEYLETVGEVSRKISLSDVKLGTRNLIKDSNDMSKVNFGSYQMTSRTVTTQTPDQNQSNVLEFGRSTTAGWLRLNPFNFELGEEYTFSVWIKRSTNGGSLPINIGVGVEGLDSREHQKRFNVGVEWQRVSITAPITRDVNIYNFVELRPQGEFLWDDTARFYIWRPQLEKGNIASDWYPAPEDSETRINHIQTEWTQTFEDFEFTVSDNQGKVNRQLQTLENSLSAINDPATGRLTVAEQRLDGFQNAVYNADGSSKVTQVAEGVRTLSEEVLKPIGKISDYWDAGVNISISRPNMSLMRVYHSVNNDSHTQTNNRIWRGSIVEGTTYTVVMRVRKVEGGPAYLTFGQAHTGTNRGYQFTVWSEFQTLTGTYTAVNNNAISIFFHTAGVYEFEELSIYPGGGASSGQLSVLNDNINARVSKGELLSQINIEAGRTLIQSEKLLLDANNVVFTGRAWIPSSVIGDLEADKITSGKLDAGKVTVVNLDANSITSNKTSFVQSAWNSINSRADMDATRLKFTHADGSSTQIGVNGLERVESGATRPYQYRTYVGNSEVSGELLANGTKINLPADFKGKDFTVVVSLQGWFGRRIELATYRPNLVRVYISDTNKSLGRFTVNGRFSGDTFKRSFYFMRKNTSDRDSDSRWIEYIDTANMTDAIFGKGITVYLTYTATY